MDGLLPGDPSHHGMTESGSYGFSHDKLEEPDHSSSNWYFSRKEIEENSTSRQDGIDLKKETYFRKSYCTFLQDLGMRLKVPQVTIATAIIFCHRFFLRQSHAKNDRRTIATVCMFLAGKVEETPRPLKDVILVSYEIIHKKDPAAVQRIKQKEVYEQQKELILLGERVVLATLGFDLNVHHPYKPLVEAIKKFKVAQNALAQVAWNFVNDGLRTSLCLQFKPHHIAAGAIFLAAKFLKVKLPSDGEKVWWQEFDVTPRQLEEVSNQMLELYEQNRTVPTSHGSEVEGSTGGVAANHLNPAKNTVAFEEQALVNDHSHVAASVVGLSQTDNPSHAVFREDGDRTNLAKYGSQGKHGVPSSARPVAADQLYTDNQNGPQRTTANLSNDYGSTGMRSGVYDHKSDDGSKDRRPQDADQQFLCANRDLENMNETSNRSMARAEDTEWKDSGDVEGPKGYRPPYVIRKIDKDKVKAALEKRRKSRGDVVDARSAAKRADLMDEDDFIERELENGVELAAEAEKIKQERRQSWSRPLYKLEPENHDDVGGKNLLVTEEQSWSRKRSRSFESEDLDAGGGRCRGPESVEDNAEEGELSFDAQEMHSPRHGSSRSERAGSPHRVLDGKNRFGLPQHPHSQGYQHHHHHQEPGKDMVGKGRHDYMERDHKRHRHENPV